MKKTIATLLLLAAPILASADSIRCSNYIFSGEQRQAPTMHQVIKACGEPDALADPLEAGVNNALIYESGDVFYVLRFNSAGYLQRVETRR